MRYAPASRQEGAPLWEALHVLWPGTDLPEPVGSTSGTSCSVFSTDYLCLAVQLTGTTTTAMALVLDDSEEAIASPVHSDSWRAWLRMSNVLALAQAPVTITTTSLALDELREQAATEAAITGSGVSAETMHELGWDTVDTTLMPEEVLALVPHLARVGIARDGEGQEVADGVMTDLSWQAQQVAVVVGASQEEVAALTAAGWRVVVPGEDPASTAAELSSLLASQS